MIITQQIPTFDLRNNFLPIIRTYLFFGIGFVGVGSVSLLPEELTGTKERLRVLELPTLRKSVTF